MKLLRTFALVKGEEGKEELTGRKGKKGKCWLCKREEAVPITTPKPKRKIKDELA